MSADATSDGDAALALDLEPEALEEATEHSYPDDMTADDATGKADAVDAPDEQTMESSPAFTIQIPAAKDTPALTPEQRAAREAKWAQTQRGRKHAKKVAAARAWEEKLEELAAYKRAHGHTNPHIAEGGGAGGTGLGRWVYNQRMIRRHGAGRSSLTPEKITKLDALGFEWRRYKKGGGKPRAAGTSASKSPRKNFDEPKHWQEKFEELAKYKEEHGHTRVPTNYTKMEGELADLGKWVSLQRMNKRRGAHVMTEERIAKLDSLDFEWSIFKKTWEDKFDDLVAYKEAHGHTNVPLVKGEGKLSSLGWWVKKQSKKKASLTEERISKLEALGFEWRTRAKKDKPPPKPKVPRSEQGPHADARWREKFAALAAFRAEHGHVRVPIKAEGELASLGKWVNAQRTIFRRGGKESSLTPERIEKLAGLGFEFNLYKKRGGGAGGKAKAAPRQFEEWGPRAVGLHGAAAAHAASPAAADPGGAPPAAVPYLPPPPSWNDCFFHFMQFRAERGPDARPVEGSSTPLGDGVDEDMLAGWCARINEQRQAQGATTTADGGDDAAGDGAEDEDEYGDTLTPKRIRALDRVGFPWVKCPDVVWQEMYDALVAFKAERGHTRVPVKGRREELAPLGKWVNSMRMIYRRGAKKSILTPERVAKLDELGFEWNPYKRTIDDDFRLLMEFYAQHGHCHVTKGNSEGKLHQFVRKLHRLRQKLEEGTYAGGLTPDHVAQLDSMGFPWLRARQDRWEDRLAELAAFRAAHGHADVLMSHAGGLGTWVGFQRRKYEKRLRGHEDAISDDQIRRLEELGIAWSLRRDPAALWESKFQELVLFQAEHGHVLVRKRQGRLGAWVCDQRMAYKARINGQKSALTDYRIQRLESIGFQWRVV